MLWDPGFWKFVIMLDVTFFQNGVRGVHWSLKILKLILVNKKKVKTLKKF